MEEKQHLHMADAHDPSDETEEQFGVEVLSRPGFIPKSPEFDALFKTEGDCPNVTVEEIIGLPEKAIGFVFHNVMTKEEMQAVMSFCEKRTEMIPASTRQDVRNCDRVEIVSEQFPKFLWDRLKSSNHPLFTAEINDAPTRFFDQPNSLDLEGTWQPYGLNRLIRVIRYPFEGHFSPHYDGHYCFSQNDRTLLTCMMYFTDKFDEGETEFLSASFEAGKSKLSTSVTIKIKPRAGSCIVFSHHLLHQGAFPKQRKSGESEVKWILRTEVCFQRTQAPEQPEDVRRALALLEKARVAENNGDFDAAQQHYRTAFRLYPELNSIIK